MAHPKGTMSQLRRGRRATPTAVVAAWAAVAFAGAVQAQNPNQFGGQDRADAASRLIVLGVQRGIDSLPLISGQSVTYEFDPVSDTFDRSTRLGPSVLPSSQVVRPGVLTVQLAASYFELAERFQPINYLLTFDNAPKDQALAVAKLGLTANAHVGLLNVSATYGISSRVDVSASIPISVVDAHATQVFSTQSTSLSVPAHDAQLSGVFLCNPNVPGCNQNVAGALNALDILLRPGGPLALRQESFSSLGFDFNNGTHVGVGRISLGGKAVLLSTKQLHVAFMPQFFLPSPSESEFAGPASAAILPQLAATLKLADGLRLHSTAGYDYDFDSAELRRFTWRAGASLAGQRAEIDLGFGGSEYDAPVQWTPSIMHGARTAAVSGSTGLALDDNTTGTSLVNLFIGAKLRVTDTTAIAGGVSIPIINPAFQPDALGTIALERTF